MGGGIIASDLCLLASHSHVMLRPILAAPQKTERLLGSKLFIWVFFLFVFSCLLSLPCLFFFFFFLFFILYSFLLLVSISSLFLLSSREIVIQNHGRVTQRWRYCSDLTRTAILAYELV